MHYNLPYPITNLPSLFHAVQSPLFQMKYFFLYCIAIQKDCNTIFYIRQLLIHIYPIPKTLVIKYYIAVKYYIARYSKLQWI